MIDAPAGDSLSKSGSTAWARHFRELTFPEVSRALRALSSAYVERRSRLSAGVALSGQGKRAAFAVFYGPLHFLLVRAVVRALPGAAEARPTVIDLGCGTGAAGAAWATALPGRAEIVAFDRSPWAVAEARSTYRAFGLPARVVQADVSDAALPASPSVVVAAFTMNELDEKARDALMTRLLTPGRVDRRVLIVEPIARAAAPWWNRWRDAVAAAGGRGDEWRFPIERPPIVEKLDRATGMDHRELTGRSLFFTAPRA